MKKLLLLIGLIAIAYPLEVSARDLVKIGKQMTEEPIMCGEIQFVETEGLFGGEMKELNMGQMVGWKSILLLTFQEIVKI